MGHPEEVDVIVCGYVETTPLSTRPPDPQSLTMLLSFFQWWACWVSRSRPPGLRRP